MLMKTLLSILLVTFMLGFTACNTSGKNNNQSEQTAVVYTCPMHPEVESDQAGTCPKCGMDLVKKDEHNHPDSSSNVDDEIQ
jgi:Cu(I)/Ag(I) efflux system membrane fusion protein